MYHNVSITNVFILLFCLLCFSGCSCSSSKKQNWYEVGAINWTDQKLNDVVFLSPTLNSGFGGLKPGYDYKATMGMYRVPVPSSGTVEWTSLDGVQHKVPVVIPEVKPPFDGILWFKIMPDNSVVAVPITKKEYFEENKGPSMLSAEPK